MATFCILNLAWLVQKSSSIPHLGLDHSKTLVSHVGHYLLDVKLQHEKKRLLVTGHCMERLIVILNIYIAISNLQQCSGYRDKVLQRGATLLFLQMVMVPEISGGSNSHSFEKISQL